MKKLISMVDFVLKQNKIRKEVDLPKELDDNNIKFAKKVLNYAQFLKQPLTLGMFVPCDEDGNVLEEPKQTSLTCSFYEQQQFFNKEKKYQQAKERVLFEGFVYTASQKDAYLGRIPLSVSPYGLKHEKLQLTKLNSDNKFHTWLQLNTIEDLVKCDLTLTTSAIKQLGL